MSETFKVEVPGAKYPCSKELQTLSANADQWKKLLKKAHGQQAKCLCQGQGAKLLNIRYLKGSDRYFLAKCANTGPEHAFDCRFFSDAESRSGLQSYVEGVVREGDDNDVSVRLSQAIQIRASHDDADPRPVPAFNPSKPKRTQRVMTLLGLLHLLWTRSNLHSWFPRMAGKRSDATLEWLLEKTAEDIKTYRMSLDRVLLTPAKKGSTGARRNVSVLQRAKKNNYRLIAVGVLEPFAGAVDGTVDHLPELSLKSSAGIPKLYLNEQVWSEAQKSFAREIAAWKKGAKTIAIAFFNLRKNSPYCDVLEVALMRVSEMLIPLDSGLEAIVEAMLRAQQRKFSKPLRFDADEQTLPDFWLNDLADEYPMEVFGMSTPDYQQRKAAKINHYQTEYAQRLGWWHWDAAADCDVTSLPPLPPATK
ncbi:uncharacterized protein DUF1173 [Pseudomonas helmanticensis]|jgi:hypothetical protein|uniref:Uncharacterized protein DUF1173 n=1 Tax=Pseudomonas helmanticensis TaxID=1471381 RepID=A0A4R7UZU4_9PSED|nr:DUF1173 family protein [Pseudomonas helmanticensis]TDV42459.1 uncharacterized protein DUF1173 [Pseudomonas helmanticensis]